MSKFADDLNSLIVGLIIETGDTLPIKEIVVADSTYDLIYAEIINQLYTSPYAHSALPKKMTLNTSGGPVTITKKQEW